MSRSVRERVRSFIRQREWLLNTVSVVVGTFFWCWYVVDLCVAGAVIEVHRVVTKPLRWFEGLVFGSVVCDD